MTEKHDKLTELREKRALDIERGNRRDLRARYGPRLAFVVSEATGKPLTLESFDSDIQAPYKLEWPKDIADAPGLVLAYVSQSVVAKFLSCLEETLGALDGKIGFHDKDYLGVADVDGMKVSALLAIAEASADSVILYAQRPIGAILVDHYRSPSSEPYSVIVQGAELVLAAQGCFDQCSSNSKG